MEFTWENGTKGGTAQKSDKSNIILKSNGTISSLMSKVSESLSSGLDNEHTETNSGGLCVPQFRAPNARHSVAWWLASTPWGSQFCLVEAEHAVMGLGAFEGKEQNERGKGDQSQTQSQPSTSS